MDSSSRISQSNVFGLTDNLNSLENKKANKEDLANVVGGLNPMGSVEKYADLAAKPKRNNDSYFVKDRPDENGDPYIFRYDAELGEWINTEQVVYKDVAKKIDISASIIDMSGYTVTIKGFLNNTGAVGNYGNLNNWGDLSAMATRFKLGAQFYPQANTFEQEFTFEYDGVTVFIRNNEIYARLLDEKVAEKKNITEKVYGTAKYAQNAFQTFVGGLACLNTPTETAGYLKNIYVRSRGAGVMRFGIGIIDQRSWAIIRDTFTISIIIKIWN